MRIGTGTPWKALCALVVAALAGCGTKVGPGGRAADAERASGMASYRLADANVVVRASPAKIVGSTVFKGFVDELKKMPALAEQMPKPPEEMLKDLLGIDPAKVARVLASVKTSSQGVLVSAMSREAINSAGVLGALSKTAGGEFKEFAKHKGVGLHAPEGDTEEAVLAFPDEKLLVVGKPSDVKKGIDNHKAGKFVEFGASLAGLLKSAPSTAHLVVAAVMTPDIMAMAKGAAPMPGAAQEVDKITALLITIEAGQALDLTVQAVSKTDKDAADARKQVSEGLAKLKVQMAGLAADPNMKPLKDLLDTAKVGGTGKVVEFSLSVRPDIVKVAGAMMQNPMALMMLMGAMGGGPGGMPGGGMAPPPGM